MTFWTTYIRQGLTALVTAVLIATVPQSVAQETQYISDMVLVRCEVVPALITVLSIGDYRRAQPFFYTI